MKITPDTSILFQIPLAGGFVFDISMTLVGTWMVMAFLFFTCRRLTRDFSADFHMTRTQNAVEVVVKFVRDQISAVLGKKADAFLPLIGSLFVFILVSNWSGILPIPFMVDGDLEWYRPPTSSLSTTAALALVVLASVTIYGIKSHGAVKYFKRFMRPLFVMLPINLLSEISRGVSLAVRLYGNILSGVMLAAIVLALAPLFVPALVGIFSLVAGTIQPYVFAMLALFYISAAIGDPDEGEQKGLEKIRP